MMMKGLNVVFTLVEIKVGGKATFQWASIEIAINDLKKK